MIIPRGMGIGGDWETLPVPKPKWPAFLLAIGLVESASYTNNMKRPATTTFVSAAISLGRGKVIGKRFPF